MLHYVNVIGYQKSQIPARHNLLVITGDSSFITVTHTPRPALTSSHPIEHANIKARMRHDVHVVSF